MNTIPQPITDSRRRLHSDEFKADAATACLQPGVSMAAIATSRGINANLLRRWVRLIKSSPEPGSQDRPTNAVASMPASTFVPLQLPAPASLVPDIVIELRRGAPAHTLGDHASAVGGSPPATPQGLNALYNTATMAASQLLHRRLNAKAEAIKKRMAQEAAQAQEKERQREVTEKIRKQDAGFHGGLKESHAVDGLHAGLHVEAAVEQAGVWASPT